MVRSLPELPQLQKIRMLKSIILHLVLILSCWIFGIWNGAHASEKTQKPLHSKFQRIELSGNSPPFLKAKQVREDLEATHWLLKQNYARYQLLKDAGTDWDKIFKDLEKTCIPTRILP